MPSSALQRHLAKSVLPILLAAAGAAGCSTSREYADGGVTTNSLPPRPAEGMVRNGQRPYGQGYGLGGAAVPSRPGAYSWNGNPTRIQEGAAPAQGLPPPQVANLPAGQRSIVVRPGDTLYSLARHYGVTVAALAEHNNLTTANLRSGQTLYLPSQAR